MRCNLAFWPILLIYEDMPSRHKNLKWGTISVPTIVHIHDKPQNISYPQVSFVSLTLPQDAQSSLKPLKIVREPFWKL